MNSLKANSGSMKSVSEKLAYSLAQLKKLQDNGLVALQSKMLERADRERLTKHGFIREECVVGIFLQVLMRSWETVQLGMFNFGVLVLPI